jgi:hypothetical protein
MKKSTLFILFESIFILLFLTVIITQVWGFSWSDKIIYRSCQGDYIKYNSSEQYCLTIVKQRQSFNNRYVIMISNKNGNEYRHLLNYPEASAIDEKEMEKTRVLWTSDGIEMTFNTGHKLFIPKEAFANNK